jgi:hypothetical protein
MEKKYDEVFFGYCMKCQGVADETAVAFSGPINRPTPRWDQLFLSFRGVAERGSF